MQSDFHLNRASASMSMAVTTMTMALTAAIAGGVMQRFRARDVLIGGTMCSMFAYSGLSFTQSYPVALVCYALTGAGMALGAVLAPLALTTRWVGEGRGKALAVVNLPLILFTCPFVIGLTLPVWGREHTMLVLGGVLLLLVFVLFAVVHEQPRRFPDQAGTVAPVVAQAASAKDIVSQPGFWFEAIGIGLMEGTGIVFVVHIVAFGLSKGVSLETATSLLSVYVGAGLVGTPLFGWLADRLGSPRALITSAGVQAICWAFLLAVGGTPLLLVAAVLGICCTPLIALNGAALTALFGHASAARAMGYSYVCKLPFIFGVGPIVGAMFDATRSYQLPFLL